MSKHRKRWSAQEKLEILEFSKQSGTTKASREYEVSVATIYKWKRAYEDLGEAGLNGQKLEKDVSSEELKRLKRENSQLKELVAEKELRLRIQEEMLKKSR